MIFLFSFLIRTFSIIYLFILFLIYLNYRLTGKNLTKVYTDAIPFFKFNFFSMILFSIVIYGSHNLIIYLFNNRRSAKNRIDIENTAPFMDSVNNL